jgi:colicin import membrane protein
MARDRDRWVAITLSVLLHGTLIAALAYGWWLFRRPQRAAEPLAIEAQVVDARTVPGLNRPAPPPPPAPTPVAPPPEEDVGPPQPSAEEVAHREQQQKEAAERAAAEKAQAEQRAADARAAEEKAAQEKAAAEEKQAAEQKRKAAVAAAAAAAAAQATQDQNEAEADLKRSLAAEARSDPSAANAALASWRAQITARITRAWIRPPTARAGLTCELNVTQVPGGAVTQVQFGQCNGDQAVRDSIEDAVYRASPLPAPPDPGLFDRNLKITFKPDLD